VKLSFCNETFEGWTFERTCAFLAETGYDGVELAPFTFAADPATLDEAWARRTGAVARAEGLEVVGFHWLLVQPPGLHLTTADDAVRRRTVAFVQHLARRCAEAGGTVLVWGSPAQRSLRPGEAYADAFARAADALRQVSAVAGEVGVRVCLEPLAPRLTDFLNTAAETVRLIERVDHPACRLHLDVAAMSTEARPAAELIREFAPWLTHFHANDPNQLGPGFGDADYRPILQALADVRYDGWLSVEVFQPGPGPEALARESLAYLRAAGAAVTP